MFRSPLVCALTMHSRSLNLMRRNPLASPSICWVFAAVLPPLSRECLPMKGHLFSFVRPPYPIQVFADDASLRKNMPHLSDGASLLAEACPRAHAFLLPPPPSPLPFFSLAAPVQQPNPDAIIALLSLHGRAPSPLARPRVWPSYLVRATGSGCCWPTELACAFVSVRRSSGFLIALARPTSPSADLLLARAPTRAGVRGHRRVGASGRRQRGRSLVERHQEQACAPPRGRAPLTCSLSFRRSTPSPVVGLPFACGRPLLAAYL